MTKFLQDHRRAILATVVVLGAPYLLLWLNWAWLPIVWLLEVGLMVVLLALIGQIRHGRPDGVLIDQTNHIKLSRLQAFLWFILVASVLLVLASARFAQPLGDLVKDEMTACVALQTEGGMGAEAAKGFCSKPQPLQIEIPQEIWWAMGISVTSLVGANLIQSSKEEREPTDSQQRRINAKAGVQRSADLPSELQDGLIHKNAKATDARWMDLVRGDEIGDFDYINVAKVQMLFLTLIIISVYSMAVWQLLAGPFNVILHPLQVAFPSFSEQLDVILGISHAGYLSAKAVNHT